MKKTYIVPEISVINVDMEALLLSLSSSGDNGLEGTGSGGDDDSGLDAESKLNNGFAVDVWD